MKTEHWDKIKVILGRALEVEATGRAAFLDQECAGDSTLRRDVEALLRSHDEAENFMVEPAYDPTSGPRIRSVEESWVGRNVGQYKVLEVIGHGGMGTVYKAEDTRLGRFVEIGRASCRERVCVPV